MKKLHSLAVTLVAALSLLPLSAGQAEAHKAPKPPSGTASFTLDAKVLDGGQQVVSVTIDTGRLGVKASSLTTDTFAVHAKGTSPYDKDASGAVYYEYDTDRTVTGVHLDKRGRIVVDLEYGYGVREASTFAWGLKASRNLVLDLAYTITQNEPITLRDGTSFTFASLTQGATVDPEVDAFGSGKAAGLAYRLYKPEGHGKRPLVVWLHGGGEGGWALDQDDSLPLIANRGAVGFVTKEAQRIFGGAYVLAPQATDYWLNDPAMGYSAKLKKLIDNVVKRNHIDTSRIYVVGASNGGYMTPQLVADNPGFFAAQVPICPVVEYGNATLLTDAELTSITTPTWVVYSKDDTTVTPGPNGTHIAATIPNALLSAYDTVTYDGVTYPGHWSWIYVAQNDPVNAKGQHVWQWMAKQSLRKGHHHW